MKILTILLTLLVPFGLVEAGENNVKGLVRNINTEEPIANATILIKEQGGFSKTDSLGIFEISASEGARIRVVHQNFFTFDTVVSDKFMVINLTPSSQLNFDEDGAEGLHYKTYQARTTIESDMLANIPQGSFFSDISMGLSLLPGINRTTGWSSLLNVRGGSPFENLYMLNGIPVFSHYIWGGHLSVFNANLVEQINVYKGNFPAKYPFSLSGVFDINYREGSPEKFSGEINASADAGIIIEGPFLENGSFIASARRSYYDFFSNLIINIDDRYLENPIKMPYFKDFYASVSQQLSNSVSLKLWILGVEDGGDFLLKYNDSAIFSDDDRLHYEVTNMLGAAQLTYKHDNLDTFDFTLFHSYYRGFQDHNDFILSVNTQARQTYNGFKLEFTRTRRNYALNTGLYALLFDANILHEVRGFVEFENSDTLSFIEFSDEIEQNNFFVNVGFAELQYTFGRTTLIPGFNISYNDLFESNRITVDPRLNLSFRLFKDGFLNSGVGSFSKPVLTYLSDVGSLPPERAIHYFLGFSNTFLDAYKLSLEFFYKDYDNLLVEYWDNSLSQIMVSNNMEGFSRGIEFLFLKSPQNHSAVDWLVAYTFATSQRAARYELDSLIWFLPPQDQKHTISIMANYRLLKTENHELSLKNRFDFNTGRPYRDFTVRAVTYSPSETTQPTQTIYIPEPTNLHLRLPYHMALDIGLEYIIDFERIDISTFLIMMNILGRENITGYVLNNRTGEKLPRISFPGETIPTAGIKVRF